MVWSQVRKLFDADSRLQKPCQLEAICAWSPGSWSTRGIGVSQYLFMGPTYTIKWIEFTWLIVKSGRHSEGCWSGCPLFISLWALVANEEPPEGEPSSTWHGLWCGSHLVHGQWELPPLLKWREPFPSLLWFLQTLSRSWGLPWRKCSLFSLSFSWLLLLFACQTGSLLLYGLISWFLLSCSWPQR